ncbi:MAG: AMP-binding protein [Deltaproteobacteria bacterium]|nr:AMP-binding protein [Deltaproteobacteria bacterium]
MLYELLKSQSELRPHQAAVIGEDRTLTYRQLFQEAGNIASALSALGLETGAPILIGIPPSPDFYAAFFGAAALGCLILPVLPSGKLYQAYRDAAPVAAMGSDDFLNGARLRCATLRHCISWSPSRGIDFPIALLEFFRQTVFRDEMILGVSSSGSTGEPKLYLRSAELILSRAKLRAQVQQTRPDDVFISTRPFNSGSAINSHIVLPILTGGRVIVHDRFERFKAAAAISKERVTVLYAVPFIFELLASIPESRRVDFTSLRLCISGSASLPRSVSDQFQRRFGITIRQRYSGSHFYPAFTYNLDGPADSVGRIDGLFPMAILDGDGNSINSETIGEIAFYIADLPDYLREVAERNPNRKGDFIYTGDLGKTDAVGNVYVVGRKSGFIKVGGNRVEPSEVESVLRAHPQVKEAVVHGFNSGESTEAVAAIVIADGELSRETLLQHCELHLDPYKCPRRLEIRDHLPRSEHGKLLRQEISKEFATGKLRESAE